MAAGRDALAATFRSPFEGKIVALDMRPEGATSMTKPKAKTDAATAAQTETETEAELDEALDESFPASDPPSITRVSAGGPDHRPTEAEAETRKRSKAK
jgi:hypothetical protein